MSAKELERIGNVDSLEEILEDIIDEKAIKRLINKVREYNEREI